MLPLRKILSNKRSGKSGSLSSAEVTSASDDFGSPETVQVVLMAPCLPGNLLGRSSGAWAEMGF